MHTRRNARPKQGRGRAQPDPRPRKQSSPPEDDGPLASEGQDESDDYDPDWESAGAEDNDDKEEDDDGEEEEDDDKEEDDGEEEPAVAEESRPSPLDDVRRHPFWQATEPQPGLARRCVVIFPWIAAACRSLPEKVQANAEKVLAALNYWFRRKKNKPRLRAAVQRRGFLWVAKTDKMLARDSLLPVKRLRLALAHLTEHGFVVRENWMFRRQRMGHFRLNWDLLQKAARRGGWRETQECINDSALWPAEEEE